MELKAQDTTVVQTLTFDSTWVRSGKWFFPTANQEYRKILMYYTLKCFNGVSGDGKYPCGEWDYLAHINVSDHRGKLDSTLRTGFNFSVNGQNPDTFRYALDTVYDYFGVTNGMVVEWDSVPQVVKTLLVYGNPGSTRQIRDDDPSSPSRVTASLSVWDASGWYYTWLDGVKIDSARIDVDNTLIRAQKSWYSNTVDYEIGRHITPYGINLNLGAGFRWVYDVTDYYPILQDTVHLFAGGLQELADVKFLFIKGKPAAEVKKIGHIWEPNMYSYSYASVSDNSRLSATTVKVAPGTEVSRVKTRITGHGHASNDGNYPHCCEWKDNDHKLLANGTEVASWKVFQYYECAENPLFPQGGTWPGAREGWCPGDVVKDYEFDVSSFVNNGQVTLDYEITPVPASNLGMGGGNYVYSMQLIQYGTPNHNNDAEVYDVVKPNNWEYYSRLNPMCQNPKIILRNAGKNKLTKAKISYKVQGGTASVYTWEGELDFLEKTAVELPVPGTAFWQGDGSNRFEAEILEVNGGADDYAGNNKAATSFKLPDIFADRYIILNLKTNNNPGDNRLEIKDHSGNTVRVLENLGVNEIYNDTVFLDYGCYSLELIDEAQDGLSYWANTAQGTGYFRIRKPGGAVLKSFNPDFGYSIRYQFAIGSATAVEEQDYDHFSLSVYPNPASGKFTADINTLGDAPVRIRLYNIAGQLLEERELSGSRNYQEAFAAPAAGVYFLQLKEGNTETVRKVVVN